MLPRTVLMRIMATALTEEILLVQRYRRQGLHGCVLAVDGHRESFRADFYFRSPGISDHVALADLAHVSHRHSLPAKPQPLLDSGSMRDAGDERDAVGRQRITVG